MAGRKRIFYLPPVNFTEFVLFKTGIALDGLNAFFALHANEVARLLSEYSTYGGYPRVILASAISEKLRCSKKYIQAT